MTKAFDLLQGGEPQQTSGGIKAFDLLSDEPPKKPQQQAPLNSFGVDFSDPIKRRREIRAAIGKLPKDQQAAARKAFAQAYVTQERDKGFTPPPSAARGLPFGSFLDEAAAGVDAGLSAITGGYLGAPYDEALEVQSAREKRAQQANPIAAVANPLVAGVASAAAIPAFQLMRGASALPQMVNMAATGAAHGAIYGAGEGSGIAERAANAGIGLGVGGVAGPAAYLVGQGIGGAATGIGRGVRSAIQRATGTSPTAATDNFSRGAVNRVQRAVVDDDLTARLYGVERARLGPEAMLADMGDNLRGQAGAIANAPGPGKRIVSGALRARDLLSADRLRTATDRAIGPPGARVQTPTGQVQNYATVDDALEGVSRTQNAAAAPHYRQFYDTRLQLTPRMRELIRRAQALDPRIIDNARNLMVAEGMPQAQRGNNSAMLDYTRRSLAAIAQKAEGKDDTAFRIASNLARDFNTEIDRALLQQHGSTAYAQARSIAGDGLRFREGVSEGQKILGDTSQTAAGLRLQRARLDPTQRAAQRVGMREDVRKRMDNATASFGETAGRESTRGRQILSSREARAKLAEVIGPNPARDLTRVADAEGRFAGTSNSVLGNSATAGRLAAQKEFPNAVPSVDVGNEIGKKNLWGILGEAGYRTMNYVLRGALDERRIMIAADAARMLVARGANRDAIVQALLTRSQQQGVTAAQRESLAQIAASIGRGSYSQAPTASSFGLFPGGSR